MSLVVTFAGSTPVPSRGSGPGWAVWSYAVEQSGVEELVVGMRVALALPRGIDVQNPQLFPGVAALADMFVQQDAADSRQYVGRTVTAVGVQTLSFVAVGDVGTGEILLATQVSAHPWKTVPFASAAGATATIGQIMPAPAPYDARIPAATVFNGRPLTDFAGTLPYASEMFGVYQPLAGWLGRQAVQRTIASRRAVGSPGDSASAAISARRLNASMPAPRDGAVIGSDAGTVVGSGSAGPSAPSSDDQGWLSPVGLINLFRQYFFEFDTFLGVPSGHLWISPGGTVEVIETSTRRTLTEKTTAQSEQTSRKVEESLTSQDDVADAVKEDNANDTKLGVSVSSGVDMRVYHGEASASVSSDTSVKKSSEQTHKRSRTQSAKVSSEITRNFKTTFKTVTDNTDTTSRRYVVQNTTDHLVNYELRRKMRKVGVQVQHIGTRLSWQVFLDAPGRGLGVGDLVHVVPEPDLSSIRKPEQPPVLQPITATFDGVFPIRLYPGTSDEVHSNVEFTERTDPSNAISTHDTLVHIYADATFEPVPPQSGYVLAVAHLASAKSGGADAKFVAAEPIAVSDNAFTVMANYLNTGDGRTIQLGFALTWNPPAIDPAQHAYDADMDDYRAQVARVRKTAYAEAVRDRLQLVSGISPRPPDDLRDEERQSVYGNLISQLELTDDPYLDSEMIRQIFDVDEMLYFAVPEYWAAPPASKPATGTGYAAPQVAATAVGRYPVPDPNATVVPAGPLAGDTVIGWYSVNESDNSPGPQASDPIQEHRVDYLITEATQPAPMGSSLGWLIQIDGDERRNEFLNAAWVKAVLPIRAGHELDALAWLASAGVEGEDSLGGTYPFQPGDPEDWRGDTLGQVLTKLATGLAAANTDTGNMLATETVFEHGFDPLRDGFRPAEPYQIFDQWIEVLPTDQIVAVQVTYDPKTGQQV